MKRMRRMIVLLALLALLVPVATAATPSDVVVDGDPNSLDPAVEWPADSWVKDDLDDPGISDQYNIRDVYATNSQTTTTPYHFIRYNTKSNILINWNSATSVYYDIDGDPSTGMTLTCPEGESIGADRKVSWRMQRDQCDIFTYNSGTKWFDRISGNCDGGPSGDGQKDGTTVEIEALVGDLGIGGSAFGVYMHFENDHPDADDVVCLTYTPENGGGEGCTPGYWKQWQHFGSWVSPYSPIDPKTYFNAVFGVGPAETLLDVLGTGGGGEKALGRHAVAALLNAASGGVSYEYSVDYVILRVQKAYATGDFEGIKDLFAGENEAYCPLDGVIQE